MRALFLVLLALIPAAASRADLVRVRWLADDYIPAAITEFKVLQSDVGAVWDGKRTVHVFVIVPEGDTSNLPGPPGLEAHAHTWTLSQNAR